MLKTAQDVVNSDLTYICKKLNAELRQMAGKSVLITGGAGFLGYYLTQTLTHWTSVGETAPIRVTVYDNFGRGQPAWITELEAQKKLTIVKQDMRLPLPADMGDHQYIFHAASIASPIFYRAHPIETMDANINGLRNLLDYARVQKERGKEFGGIVFFSSSEIYGDPDPAHIPTPETYRGLVSCTGPRACYDESKRFGETLCVVFAQQHNVPTRIARPFNNYGPGLKITDGRVIPDFAKDILSGRDIVMLSDGSAKRTFTYVTDAVIGYYKLMLKGRNGEPYNIGIEKPEISMAELAESMASIGRELFGYKGKVVRQQSADKNYTVDNPNRRSPIIDKARQELGFDPAVPLEDGLRRTLLWYSENRETPRES